MNAPLWGLVSPDNLGELVVKVLAVAGGALVGGLGSGLLVQLLVRLTTTARVPKRVLQVVRILGAIALGWLVALFLFGTGTGTGGGLGWFGGGGGGGGGTGTGKEGPGTSARAESTGREVPVPVETGRAPSTPAESARMLRVDVLIDRRNNATVFRPEGRQDVLDLAGLKGYLQKRRAQAPTLQRLELVIYLNSPDRDSGPVKDLLAWAGREGLETSIATPATNAPSPNAP
jgi:hypothetical protein